MLTTIQHNRMPLYQITQNVMPFLKIQSTTGWSDDSMVTSKTPTVVLFNKKGEFDSFGYKVKYDILFPELLKTPRAYDVSLLQIKYKLDNACQIVCYKMNKKTIK